MVENKLYIGAMSRIYLLSQTKNLTFELRLHAPR